MRKVLEEMLKKYPRGYHKVNAKEMDEILNAYEYQMLSPGYFSGKFQVSRETLRSWGVRKIIHYFHCKRGWGGGYEIYIPLYTFIDAPLPDKENYKEVVEQIKRDFESTEREIRQYYERKYGKK
jgi:hypothetical protein